VGQAERGQPAKLKASNFLFYKSSDRFAPRNGGLKIKKPRISAGLNNQ
jgi:hypothetical protein